MKKTYRVLLTETLGFYQDVEAESAEEAREKISEAVQGDGEMELNPIEDTTYYEGYKIQDVKELEHEKTTPQS